MRVLRRTRLPLVVSLFLAALLGTPTAAGPVTASMPVPASASAVAAPVAAAPAPAPVAVAVAETPTEPPAVPAPPARPVRLAAPLLTDQVSTAATAPRGPPTTA